LLPATLFILALRAALRAGFSRPLRRYATVRLARRGPMPNKAARVALPLAMLPREGRAKSAAAVLSRERQAKMSRAIRGWRGVHASYSGYQQKMVRDPPVYVICLYFESAAGRC